MLLALARERRARQRFVKIVFYRSERSTASV